MSLESVKKDIEWLENIIRDYFFDHAGGIK